MINNLNKTININKKKCIGCNKIMPEYVYHNNRIECIECYEKRLSIYKYIVPPYLKLIKKINNNVS